MHTRGSTKRSKVSTTHPQPGSSGPRHHRVWSIAELVTLIYEAIERLEDARHLALTSKTVRACSLTRILPHMRLPADAPSLWKGRKKRAQAPPFPALDSEKKVHFLEHCQGIRALTVDLSTLSRRRDLPLWQTTPLFPRLQHLKVHLGAGEWLLSQLLRSPRLTSIHICIPRPLPRGHYINYSAIQQALASKAPFLPSLQQLILDRPGVHPTHNVGHLSSLSWWWKFVKAIPTRHSLSSIGLLSCPVPYHVLRFITALPGLTTLRLDCRSILGPDGTRLDFDFAGEVLHHHLTRVTPDRLRVLQISVMISTLELQVLARFIHLEVLDLQDRGGHKLTRTRLEPLALLTSLRRASFTIGHVNAVLDDTLFCHLLKGWTKIEALGFYDPSRIAKRPPMLRISDLRHLKASAPTLQRLAVCLNPAPLSVIILPQPLQNGLELDLTSTPLTPPEADNLLLYLTLLCRGRSIKLYGDHNGEGWKTVTDHFHVRQGRVQIL